MPEGDTLLRTAKTLERAIGGRVIIRARAHDGRLRAAALVGRRVEKVEARGKHLLITIDDGAVLHSHLGMTGAWHVYRPGERWQLPDHLARLVLETDAYVAVCFRAPQIDRIEGGADADSRLGSLGPDALAPDFDPKEAARRLRALGDAIVGDALLDQHALAGVGNIWRSETLFAAKVHPERRVSSLSDAELEAIARIASELLRRSIASDRAPSVGPSRFVYDRFRLPCRRCGVAIERHRVGKLQRSAYFCPGCQRID
jgi:endonuclease VIII